MKCTSFLFILAGLGLAVLSVPTLARSQAETAAGTSREAILASGSISGKTYTNGFFHFSYEFPQGLTLESQDDLRKVMETGHRAAYGQEPETDPEHQEAMKRIIPLFSAVGVPAKPGEVPEQILIMATDASTFPGLSSRVVVNGLVAQMLSAPGPPGMRCQLIRPPTDGRLGGQLFSSAELKADMNLQGRRVTIFTAFWATVVHGYAVIWQFAAPSTKQLNALEKTTESIRFEPVGTGPQPQN